MIEWRLDELAHAGPEHLDPGYVEGYDRKAQTDPSVDIEVLRGHGFGADSTMVDLGAGTGVFAFAAAAECRHVVAVDVSAAMVERVRLRSAELGLGNVDVVHAGFLTYEHAGPPARRLHAGVALKRVTRCVITSADCSEGSDWRAHASGRRPARRRLPRSKGGNLHRAFRDLT